MEESKNPWGGKIRKHAVKTVDVGGMDGYFALASQLFACDENTPPDQHPSEFDTKPEVQTVESTQIPLIDLQKQLLDLVRNYYSYQKQLKTQQDVQKYGEYITRSEID